MQPLHFCNQTIIHQGQTSPLYQLTHGSAILANACNQTIAIIRAPYYLNLIEHLYGVPALKTVKAFGKCQVQTVSQIKDSHRGPITEWKKEGLRKSKFKLFWNTHSAYFYQLVSLGNQIEIRHQQSWFCQQNHFYLIYSGSAAISGCEQPLKVVKAEEGEVLIGNGKGYLVASSTAKVLEISLVVAKALMCQRFQPFEQVLFEQRKFIESLQSRNQRLSGQLRRSRNKLFTKCQVPQQFLNKIEQKAVKLEKFCRAKSCFGNFLTKPKRQIEFLKEERLKEVMRLNVNRYVMMRVCKDGEQGVKKFLSSYCKASPTKKIKQIEKEIDNQGYRKQSVGISHLISKAGKGRGQLRRVKWQDSKKRSFFRQSNRLI